MKLVYIDPNCSGLQTVDCKAEKDIEKTLSKKGIDESSCGGETVHYTFIGKDGKVVSGTLDFT